MFTIKTATANDLAVVARLHVEGWKGAYGGIVDQGYLDGLRAEDREQQWREWFDPAQGPVLIGMKGDVPAGFINFGRLRTPPPGSSPIRPLYAGEIYALYILPEFWRLGLGDMLVRAAAGGLLALRCKSMCLWVLEKNERACAFYRNMGGERCGKKDIMVGPTAAREICFGWRDTAGLCGAGAGSPQTL